MSEGWGNPVVGGTTLRIPAIQSPNFSLANQTGWAIFADGSAYFFNVTAAGTITGGTLVVDGPSGGVFIYTGTPGPNNLIGSWTGQAGTDAFGNTYPAGLSVNQGIITGIGIDSTTITNSTFQGDVLDSSTISNPSIIGGTITETTVEFDTTGGQLLVYASTTTVIPQTANGTYTFTPPAGVTTAKVELWGASAGGDGGSTSVGGNGGGAGEYAAEPNYPVIPLQSYTYVVGNGGGSSTTGQGHGGDGGQSFFDNSGVLAHGGLGNGAGGTGSVNTVHHDGGSGGTSNSNTGAASGGNSGNATAKGNNGISPTSSAGAAAPAAQTGSGRGGAGGASGANGSAGGSPGGGGGGAGMGSNSTGSKTVTYEATWTGAYLGPDATVSPNSLRSTSLLYQGGETASGGTANGNQRSVMAFNRTQIASDFAGFTITGCMLKLVNQHSWFNSGMTFTVDTYAGLPSSAPGSYPSGDFQSQIATGSIAEGATHTYSLGASVGNGFANGTLNGLGLGAEVAANAPYNLNYYGWFSGGHGTALEMTITGTQTVSGSNTSGVGEDGQSKITYTSGQTLIAAISPLASTDVNGNAFAAGFTGMMTAIQPGTNPTVVETWHTLPLANGWIAQNGTAPARYKLMPDNTVLVEMQLNDSSATSGTICTLPAGYIPTQGQFGVLALNSAAAGVSVAVAQITTTGAIQIASWTKQSKQYLGFLVISLD